MSDRKSIARSLVAVALLALTAISLVQSSRAVAADSYQWTAVGQQKNWISVQLSNDGSTMAATADFPYTSTDSGTTWTQQAIAGNPWGLQTVSVSGDGTNMAVVARGATSPNGFAYTSTNGGATWTQRQWNTGFTHLAGSRDGQYLVASARTCCAGANPGLFISTNAGASWSQVQYVNFFKASISDDGQKIFAVGANGLVYSSNGGSSFSTISISGSVNNSWAGVGISGDGSTLVAVGGGTGLYVSTNAGATWTLRVSDVALADVDLSTNGQSIIAGGNTPLTISTDGGATWTQQSTSRNYTSVSVSHNGAKFAATETNGFIYVSSALATTTTTPATTTTLATTTTSTVVASSTTTGVASTTVATVSPQSTLATSTNSESTRGADTSRNTDSVEQRVVAGTPNSSSSTTTTTTVAKQQIQGATVEASPGSATVLLNGKIAKSSVSTNLGWFIITVDEVIVKMKLMDTDGNQVGLDSDGNLRLEGGQKLVVELVGLSSGTTVNFYVFSTPIPLGSATVSQDDVTSASFDVPTALEDGDHRIVVNGVTNNGESVAVVAGVKVGDESGSSPIRIVIFVVIGLAVIAAISIPARRRSARVK